MRILIIVVLGLLALSAGVYWSANNLLKEPLSAMVPGVLKAPEAPKVEVPKLVEAPTVVEAPKVEVPKLVETPKPVVKPPVTKKPVAKKKPVRKKSVRKDPEWLW